MKDRFAADWRKGIAGQRHKGMRVGTLWMKYSEVTGDVTLTGDFLSLDPVAKADVLGDIIGLLKDEYERAVETPSSAKARID